MQSTLLEMPQRGLVVDDDVHIRVLEAKILEKRGYSVDQAADGHEAIARVDEDGYSALVLDLQIPRVSGFDVIDHLIRHDPEMLRRTVVATAFPQQANSAGLHEVCKVIIKPFDIEELIAAVAGCGATSEHASEK